jgi:hypothetical protein
MGGPHLRALLTYHNYHFDLHATHARTLLPAAMVSVSLGCALLRVRVISRRAWTVISDGTLTPELMAMNPESFCRTTEMALTSRGPSMRQSHARRASGRNRVPREFGPPDHRQVIVPSVQGFDSRFRRIPAKWLNKITSRGISAGFPCHGHKRYF